MDNFVPPSAFEVLPAWPSRTAASSLVANLAIREWYRDEYWRKHDPILDDRLLWRAQTFRHTVHLLPGQTILELGCGEFRFTRVLLQVSRGENTITAATFQTSSRSDLAAEENQT